ncbi:class I lanthipeptide [Pedobacter lusitanus]|nr:class I lanthipeptide [Pedobacter lusitanus]
MKTPKSLLNLNKRTIVKLNTEQMKYIAGGRPQARETFDTTMMTTGTPGTVVVLTIHNNF